MSEMTPTFPSMASHSSDLTQRLTISPVSAHSHQIISQLSMRGFSLHPRKPLRYFFCILSSLAWLWWSIDSGSVWSSPVLPSRRTVKHLDTQSRTMKKNFHLILRILRENSFCPKLSTLKLTLFAMCFEKIFWNLDFLAEKVLEHYCNLSFFGLEFFCDRRKSLTLVVCQWHERFECSIDVFLFLVRFPSIQ